MKPWKTISIAALLVVGMFGGTSLQAQMPLVRITHVNFSGPVEIPGRVLPAGDYVFQLDVIPNSDNRVVQIRDKDGVNVIATLLTMTDYRLKPTGDTVMLFRERAADKPPALRAWFYPGENFGHEFVYGKTRATELAAANSVNVPSVADNTSDNSLNNAEVSQVNSNGQNEAATTTPVTTQNTAPVAANQNNNNRNNNNLVASNQPLPKTASEVPLVSLAGALFIGFGAILAFVNRRRSSEQGGS
jgi:LPXTG-motif cell wall-anchored protein